MKILKFLSSLLRTLIHPKLMFCDYGGLETMELWQITYSKWYFVFLVIFASSSDDKTSAAISNLDSDYPLCSERTINAWETHGGSSISECLCSKQSGLPSSGLSSNFSSAFWIYARYNGICKSYCTVMFYCNSYYSG